MSRNNKTFGKFGGNRHHQVTGGPTPPQPPEPPPLSPQMELRRRAVMRLDILPPYQSVMPQEMVLTTEEGQEIVKVFRGLTKREHMAAMFVAAAIQHDGMPLQDSVMASYARMALAQSEAVLQTISKQRGDDVKEVMAKLAEEDVKAAAMETAAMETAKPTSID